MLELSLFSLAVYGLAFLLADAKIFGCPANGFPSDPTEDDFAAVARKGMIPLRQLLLRIRFLRKLLSCYFCLGVWCGMVVHGLLYTLAHVNPYWRDSYSLWGPLEPLNVIISTLLAALVGGPVCYAVDLVITWLETASSDYEECD